MTWVNTTVGKDFSIWTETLTTKTGGNGTSNWSSPIDFIPPGTDFSVICNTAKTTLSTSTHVELFTSFTTDSYPATTAGRALRIRRSASPWLPVTSAIQSAQVVNTVDVSLKGQFPIYFLKFPKGGGSVKSVVIVGQRSVGLL
jgi:hypothetical protein